MLEPYKFDKPLIEGVIKYRIRSYVLVVELDGILYKCHCPCITNFNIDVSGRPCLLWESSNPGRKTKYTVKAISLDTPSTVNKTWYGIDQTESNRYVEHYLRQNAFPEMVDGTKEVLREQTIGKSRLDFKVGDVYIENKTCVGFGDHIPGYIAVRPSKPTPPSEHFYKHVQELSDALDTHEGAILLATFLYGSGKEMEHDTAVDKGGRIGKAMAKGVQGWQCNFRITPEEVTLVSYEKINS